MVLREKWIPYY
ncbi:hypothetical protein VULLAG_LOCUS23308 [Vulpes lagopus]